MILSSATCLLFAILPAFAPHAPAPLLAPPAALDTLCMSVDGDFAGGGTVTYTLLISNSGSLTAGDNPGDECTDILPPELTLTGATATAGVTTAAIATNTVTWNGSVAPGEVIVVTITATIKFGHGGAIVTNRSNHSYDSNGDGTNDTTVLSNGSKTPPYNVPTTFAVSAAKIPTLSELALALLSICLAAAGFYAMKG